MSRNLCVRKKKFGTKRQKPDGIERCTGPKIFIVVARNISKQNSNGSASEGELAPLLRPV
jgi:hypothetical protein